MRDSPRLLDLSLKIPYSPARFLCMLLIKIWYIRRQFSELLFKHIIYRFEKGNVHVPRHILHMRRESPLELKWPP